MFDRITALVVLVIGLFLTTRCAAQDRVSETAVRLRALPAALLQEHRTDDHLVDAVVLATLMKLPTAEQRGNAKKHFQKHAKDRQRACEDLIWAYVNTKEFMHVHGFTLAENSALSEQLSVVSEKKAPDEEKPPIDDRKGVAMAPTRHPREIARVDLTKIDRTIAKEPDYKNQPKYCLLVFGPEAKTRVWLVLDGRVLHVDRNGNGNLTEDGERIPGDRSNPQLTEFLVGAVVTPEERARHTDLRLSVRRLSLLGAASDPVDLSVTVAGRRWWATVKQFSARRKMLPSSTSMVRSRFVSERSVSERRRR